MASKSALEHKDEGNRLYKSCNYPRALSCYSEAIELDSSNPTYFGNRSQCKIQMKLFHEAISDAKMAISLDPSGVKHQYRLAMALSGIGEHKEACEILERFCTQHDDIPGALKRERKYLEHSNGEFDMDEMLHLAKEGKEIEIENYFGPISIGMAGENGRGLFALRDIKKGELVFVCKAELFSKEPLESDPKFICNAKSNIQISKVQLKLMELLTEIIPLTNPLTLCRLSMLWGANVTNQPLFPSVEFFSPKGYQPLKGNEEFYSSENLKSQLTNNVYNLVVKNEASASTVTYVLPTLFTNPSIDHGPEAAGIWLIHSFLNHACLPNTFISFAGDICISRANSLIKKGSEITRAYINGNTVDIASLFTIKDRRANLIVTWEFVCNCELCQFESDPKNQSLMKRAVELYYRACEIIAESKNVTKQGVKSHFRQLDRFFSEVVKLAEEMGLGPQVFNDTVWTAIMKIIYQYGRAIAEFLQFNKLQTYFQMMDRVEKFFCEKELEHETRFWYMYMQMIVTCQGFIPSVKVRKKHVEENFDRVKALQMYF